MADSNLQRSVTTATARKLATTTKTTPLRWVVSLQDFS